jgi:hypothetical protein
MEYEQCVSSYQNIYEEVWRIFSYLSAISAAILVFGGEFFSPSITVSVSMLPLIFWFLGVFLPMNRYGYMRSARLADIEKRLNQEYGVELQHFSLLECRTKRGRMKPYGFGWRVRSAAWAFWVVTTGVCLGFFSYALWTGQVTKTKEPAKFDAKVELSTKEAAKFEGKWEQVPSAVQAPAAKSTQ